MRPIKLPVYGSNLRPNPGTKWLSTISSITVKVIFHVFVPLRDHLWVRWPCPCSQNRHLTWNYSPWHRYEEKWQFFLSEPLKLKFVKPPYFRPPRHHSFRKLMKFKISLKEMILETPICPIFWIFLKFTATISDKISLSKHDRSFDVSVNCKWHCNKACKGVAAIWKSKSLLIENGWRLHNDTRQN